jgi:carbonic anhydrase
MEKILARLKSGALQFRKQVYAERKEVYERAAQQPQKPHTLVITCADSRIDPEGLVQAGPGEIFVTRNVGNIVPAYNEMPGGVSAVVEYAVSGLRVEHIVVCGHSDCGAMKALLHPGSIATMPAVQCWLNNAQSARRITEANRDSGETDANALRRATEQNVLMQITHLKTHPAVAEAIAQRRLTISGWVYDIGMGEVRIAEGEQRIFKVLKEPAAPVSYHGSSNSGTEHE